MRIGFRIFILIATIVLSPGPAFPLANAWPSIQSFSQHFAFASGSSASARIVILTEAGKPGYELECHSGSYADPEYTYAGAFDCRLTATKLQGPYSNLLTADPYQSTDETRGRFLASQVVGPCSTYPEYGAVRHFRLRKMLLTLTITKALEDPHDRSMLRSFEFIVKAHPDPSAVSGISQAPGEIPPPPGSCSQAPRPFTVRKAVSLRQVGNLAESARWPQILPTAGQETFTLGPSRRVALTEFGEMHRREPNIWPKLAIPVTDQDHRVRYDFQCGEFVPAAGIWGIACGLFDRATGENLLAGATDPYSRINQAFLLPFQLSAPLKDSTVWGTRREFTLRGMRVLLAFDRAAFHDASGTKTELLRSIRISARIVPDPAALNAKPSIPGVPLTAMYK